MAISGLKLRCALSETNAITLTAASPGVSAGTMELVEDVVGVYATDADTDEEVAFIISAPKILVPCAAASGSDYKAGAKVYFDATDEEVNESSSSPNALCGVVLEQPAGSAEEVLIALDGTLGIVA